MNIEADAIYGGPASHKMSRFNPTKVLIALREENPNADKGVVLALFRARMLEAVRDDEDCLHPLADSYFFREWNNLEAYEARAARRQSHRSEGGKKATAEKTEQFKEHLRTSVLLDTLLPDGKKARYSTFGALKSFGAFWQQVSLKGKPTQIVGQVLTEKDLQAIWVKFKK
jgi:hypothetical protein